MNKTELREQNIYFQIESIKENEAEICDDIIGPPVRVETLQQS